MKTFTPEMQEVYSRLANPGAESATAALAALEAGLSTIPPKQDGSKAPYPIKWKAYQESFPTIDEIQSWYGDGLTGVGLVTGAVSGNLECLDFDTREVWEQYKDAARKAGLAELVKRVGSGYAEQSPNGFHLLYYCDSISGNTKLAQAEDIKTLIETRGEGGFIIVAPSTGVNPAGDYVLKAGGFDSIERISPHEREQLHALAKAFDEAPRQEYEPQQRATDSRPGDEYIASTAWPQVLEPAGWVRVFERDGTTHWRRPGKKQGVSATTGHNGSDLLYVFSTSTEFDSERGYNRFSVYALLNHGGDFKAAAKALSEGRYEHGTHAGVDGIKWGTPGPIKTKLRPVPALPERLIPEPLRKWIMDVADRMQTPPDFAAVTAITVAASVIGTACAIRPKRRDNWTVIPNLWGACIGRPSVVLKSPSMKEPLDMLTRLQADAGEVYKSEMRSHEFERKVAEIQAKDTERAMAKAIKSKDSLAVDALRDDYLNAEDIPEPIRRLFKTNETSIQSQTVLQTQNPRGLLTFRDEITGLLTRWDKKEHEDERAYFLEGWNGDGSYTDFKIGRGLTDADHICISLFGGIQPDKLRRYLYQSMNGGNDGLVQRLQLAVYPDEPSTWELIDRYPDTAEKNRVYDILKMLADMDFTQLGAEQREYDKFPFMRFSSEGQEVFNNWLTDLQVNKLNNEDRPLMAEHLGKYRSLMPTLALVFHLIEIADGTAARPVSKQAAILAAAWCDYLEEHARRIYGIVMSAELEAASILAERISKLPTPFTAKDVYRRHWTGFPDTATVEMACRVLEDEDWLHKELGNSTGGRPSAARYWINPAVLGEK